MDVLVLLEDCDEVEATGRQAVTNRPAGASLVAYVHSAPSTAGWEYPFGGRGGARGREVITLCGEPQADRLAVALAAAVEGRRASVDTPSAVRHLGVWDGAGASGDSAWRDQESGQLVSHDVAIAADTIEATARQLLADAGRVIRQTAAELSMLEWPEGARRAISFTLPLPGDDMPSRLRTPGGDDTFLALLREADGYAEVAYDEVD